MLPPLPVPPSEPGFFSTQVSEARRYYLNLTPEPSEAITVICGGCERGLPDYCIQRLTFPFTTVEFVAEGEGHLELAGAGCRLRAGMTFSYGPGAVLLIRNEPARPMLKYFVNFSGAEGDRLLAQSPLAGWRAAQVCSPQEVRDIFEMLQREGASSSPFSARICAIIVALLLAKISEKAVPCSDGESLALGTYLRAKQWIEVNYLHLKTAEEAARACHVESSYLCRLFQRFGHTTPYRFLMRLKMNRAAELLVDRGMLVKEVAAALNFLEPAHFSRSFKRVYGLAPEGFIRHSRGWTPVAGEGERKT